MQGQVGVPHQYGRMDFCPPMSHTLSFKPSCMSDLMLKPCVGVMVVMSSSDSFLRMVVLPALSNPSTRMRACLRARSPHQPPHCYQLHYNLV